MTTKPTYKELEQRIKELEREAEKRKEAENSLKESEARFRELAELLPETIFEMDERGNLTFLNRSGLEAFGYTREDLEKGLNGLQGVIPEDRDRAIKNILKLYGGEDLGGLEYTAQRKDGTTFPVLMYLSAIVQEEKAIGVRGFAVDNTERRQMED